MEAEDNTGAERVKKIKRITTSIRRTYFLGQVWMHRLRTSLAILIRVPFKYNNWYTFLLSRFRDGRCVLNLRDGVSIEIRNRGQDRAHVSECLVLYSYDSDPAYRIAETDVVLDVGANIGAFTVRAASLARKGRVVAIEPQVENLQLLESNIRRNGFTNVTVVHGALSGSDGQAALAVGMELCPSLVFSFPGMTMENVPTFKLRTLLDQAGIAEVDLMKMDCEGAEFDILLGASRADLRRIRRLVMEYHNVRRDRSHRELIECLQQAGFEVYCTGGSWNGLIKGTRKEQVSPESGAQLVHDTVPVAGSAD